MTVRSKLIIIFLSLVILPAVLGVAVLFTYVHGAVRQARIYQLESIADQQKDRFEAFFAERRGDAEFFQTLKRIKDLLPLINKPFANHKDPLFVKAMGEVEERLADTQRIYGYTDAMLTDTRGRITAIGNPSHRASQLGKPLSILDPKAFVGGRKGVHFSGIYKTGTDGQDFGMLLTAPITDDGGAFIGEVALEMDAGSVFDLVKDATGLGSTGETFIGIPNGEYVLFVNPFHPERNKSISVSQLFGGKVAKPMQEALRHRTGSGESVDYLGHDVLAAWRYAPATGWGLVTKIDSSEIYSMVARLKAQATALGLIIVLFCMTAALAISKSIVEPVRAMQKGAEVIGSGNLDFKVGTQRKDEVGQLSRAIDSMAENLKKITASRDELDQAVMDIKRTEDILRASLRLSEYALKHSLDELLTNTLDEAESLTGSKIGFFHFVAADQQTLELQTWSTNTLKSMCTAEGKGAHYPIDKAGVWVDAVAQRHPVIHNDYASLPNRKGLPVGHAPVIRELVAPILRSGVVMGVVGVGNKPDVYVEADVEAVSQLANRAWDIILAKRAEDEVRKLNEDLERRVELRTAELTASNKELEAFSYSVSHDLRAPLRHVQGFVEMLGKNAGASLDEKGHRYLDTISSAASQMGTLIDDLLTFSRMGRSELHLSWISLENLFGSVITEMREETKGRDIAWKVGSLPQVRGDVSMLRLVVVNLLSNAVKFTRKRDIAEIEVGSRSDSEDEFVVYVKDNGVGFDMQYVDKLFGVFQRLHRAEDFEGTGIGLANVRRIITRHGGRTWAESSPGEGTTVYFTLPDLK